MQPPRGWARRGAQLHALILDHGVLRLGWKNRAEVAPGVWRMNQPGAGDLARLADAGVRVVVNLRGPSRRGYRLLEDLACRALGLRLIHVRMRARTAPPRAALLELVDVLETVEAPLVLHCKSGADRTGFAAALWRMLREGDPVAVAARQLCWRHGHNPRSAAGVQGQVLRSYAAEGEARGLSFRDWVAQHYDPARVSAEFAHWRRGRDIGGAVQPLSEHLYRRA